MLKELNAKLLEKDYVQAMNDGGGVEKRKADRGRKVWNLMFDLYNGSVKYKAQSSFTRSN